MLPADLPVERAIKFETVLNMRAAKTLSLWLYYALTASVTWRIAVQESAFDPKRTLLSQRTGTISVSVKRR
jgi:hypothetical protein